ncbi:MAG: alpha/beta hydrolase [Candidatus Kuenenia sp.]|nr:alpha/beta hydrolase [Candidatus Kuenenia hertensis]
MFNLFYMTIRENRVKLDFANIHYFVAGDGDRSVVLLHGGGTNSAMLSWKYIIQPLSQKYKVYAPDWPSYGQSTTFTGKYTNEMLIDCLHRLMDVWQLRKANLVGLSMGGSAALGYTLLFPDRVNTVVLASSYGLQHKAPYHKLSYILLHMPFFSKFIWACMRRSHFVIRSCLQKIIHDPALIPDELVHEIFTVAQRSCIEKAFFSWLRNEVLWNGMRTCYEQRFHELKTRTLLLHGDYDPLVPLFYAQQASLFIKNAKLHVFHRCGHWLTRERPDEFNQVVLSFLDESYK